MTSPVRFSYPHCTMWFTAVLALAACTAGDTAETDSGPPTPQSDVVSVPTVEAAGASIGTASRDWWNSLDSLAENPFPPADSLWLASFEGVGTVRAGMSATEARARHGGGFEVPADTEGCDYAGVPGAPEGLSVMIEQGVVTRIDLRSATVATDRGVRVGDTEDDVRRAYGSLVRQEPDPYAGPSWHYLIVTPPMDTTFLMIFETNGWRVLSYRVGRAGSVRYIEGCS